jgi:hypothetical protein
MFSIQIDFLLNYSYLQKQKRLKGYTIGKQIRSHAQIGFPINKGLKDPLSFVIIWKTRMSGTKAHKQYVSKNLKILVTPVPLRFQSGLNFIYQYSANDFKNWILKVRKNFGRVTNIDCIKLCSASFSKKLYHRKIKNSCYTYTVL